MLAAPVTIALTITLTFMALLRPLAVSVGLVDRPGGRKAHVGEVPIIGGMAMFAGIFFGLTLVPELSGNTWYLLLSGALLVVVGVVDDKYDVPAELRLVAQTCAVIIMVFGGGLIVWDIGNPLAFGDIELGRLALIFTVLVTLTVINAFNLVDGVDGLAGSMAIIALLGIVVAGGPSLEATVVATVATASVLGFLVFNYPADANRRLRSFMGDAGSTLLGLIVVWLTISISQGSMRAMSPVIGLWFVALPLFDLFTCFVRRIARGRSPLRPGREHFHHTLYRAGLAPPQILAVLTAIAVIYAGFGLYGHFYGLSDSVMFATWVACGSLQYPILRKSAALFRHHRRRIVTRNASDQYGA